MRAAVGSVVGLYMDTPTNLGQVDCIRTDSGRTYRIVDVREQMRGKHRGRWHIRALVIDPATVTNEDVVVLLRWYRR